MPSVFPATSAIKLLEVRGLRRLPIGLGLLTLYAPTTAELARGLWTRDEYMHGPIVAVVVLWLIWQERALLLGGGDRPRTISGGATLIFGLLLYVLGRSQDIIILEVGSLIPVLAGILLATCGWKTLLRMAFPLLFVLFMLPLPSLVVDALTGPLKHNVSAIAESILYTAGYPIARAGVVLSVGPYQLLVADACSGLHSLISMSAMGFLYIHLLRHRSFSRNAILVACLLPIAFAANVVRVIVLVLVTCHFGDEAGQGFIHDLSGVSLFIVGLLLLFAVDTVLGRFRSLGRAASVTP